MKRKIIISFVLIILILLISFPNFAATVVIPNGTVFDNITASQSYEQCMNMKTQPGEVLYGTNVYPHLTTNADWGIVSYFSYSKYGMNAQNETGVIINIDGKEYFSTNGNETGIMDWGNHYTQTSALNINYAENPLEIVSGYRDGSAVIRSNLEAIYQNRDTRFVEIISDVNKKGCGLGETTNIRMIGGFADNNISSPIPIRRAFFSLNNDGRYATNPGTGRAGTPYDSGKIRITFRPIVWNY